MKRQDIVEEFSDIAAISSKDLTKEMWRLREVASYTVSSDDMSMIMLLVQELLPSMRQEDRINLTEALQPVGATLYCLSKTADENIALSIAEFSELLYGM